MENNENKKLLYEKLTRIENKYKELIEKTDNLIDSLNDTFKIDDEIIYKENISKEATKLEELKNSIIINKDFLLQQYY